MKKTLVSIRVLVGIAQEPQVCVPLLSVVQVSIRVLVGIAQELPHRPQHGRHLGVSIRVLVGIAQEPASPRVRRPGGDWFQSVCWSE